MSKLLSVLLVNFKVKLLEQFPKKSYFVSVEIIFEAEADWKEHSIDNWNRKY